MSDMDCVFCKIVSGEIPSRKVYENDRVLAFYDLSPQAPVHVLVIPKAHVSGGMADITRENSRAVADVFEAVPEIAGLLGLTGGFRVAANSGEDAGQTVLHLHFHLLGGGPLGKMA